MRIRATFIGTTPGFEGTVPYFLKVEQGSGNEIIIDRVDGLSEQHVYETLEAFLRNWDNVTMYSK